MKIEIRMPQLGESIAEGKVIKWLKQVGDLVARDENLLEVMTDKVTVEIPSIAAGKLVEILVEEDEQAQVGDVLGYLEGKDLAKGKEGAEPSKKKVTEIAAAPKAAPAKKKEISSSEKREIPPGVQTLAQELKIDLAQVQGSGEAGRVRKKDVLDYVAKQRSTGAAAAAEPEVVLREGDQLVPLSVMRQAIAEHMVLSKRTIPHVMTAHEVDMSAVVREREKSKSKVSVTAYIAQATAVALKKFPDVNAQFSAKGIVRRKAIHIGVAVATEAGLLVPAIHDADKKTLAQLHTEIKDLADRARGNKLKLDDVRGATFTITNPGIFNSYVSAPVIPYGQSGILGVGAMKERAVVVQGKIEVRPIVVLSLSFDHRTLDGATADLFLEAIRAHLEQKG